MFLYMMSTRETRFLLVQKSIAIKVLIQPIHETLTDEDLEKISSDLIDAVNNKISGTLREE